MLKLMVMHNFFIWPFQKSCIEVIITVKIGIVVNVKIGIVVGD